MQSNIKTSLNEKSRSESKYKRFSKLTLAIILYKSTGNEKFLKFIFKDINSIIFSILSKTNYLQGFRPFLIQEIAHDIQTLVFIDTIKKFDINRNCEFSTLFVRNIYFYLRYIRKYYLQKKRKPDINLLSIEEL